MYITELDFNQPAAWIGWVAVVVVFCIFGWLFYRQRKAKAIKIPAKYWRVPILGFGEIFVTKIHFVDNSEREPEEVEYTEETANVTANSLALARDEIWATCVEIYEQDPEHGWPVPRTIVQADGMDEKHPHVEWTAPHGYIRLLLQDMMYYWFVRECHNVFRYRIHGMEWIYKTKDADDIANTMAVEAWIAANYGA